MIGKLLPLFLLIAAAASHSHARGKSRLPDCRKVVVRDSDRRPFSERDSFTLDVDGDGRPDTITARTYAVKATRKGPGGDTPGARETHWISFDLKASGGPALRSFFRYDYGTDEADYWVYALIPCSLDGDGRPDLLFYSGDDTTDETVILVNRGSAFKVHSRKVEGPDL
jgi:hypothetical protein